MRSGIRSLLTRESLGICGEAENGKQAFEKFRELKLNLVILNVSMPVMNSVEAAREYVGSHLVRKLTVKRLLQPVGHFATLYVLRIQTLSGASMAKGKTGSGNFS